jgi:hypothetical protein
MACYFQIEEGLCDVNALAQAATGFHTGQYVLHFGGADFP